MYRHVSIACKKITSFLVHCTNQSAILVKGDTLTLIRPGKNPLYTRFAAESAIHARKFLAALKIPDYLTWQDFNEAKPILTVANEQLAFDQEATWEGTALNLLEAGLSLQTRLAAAEIRYKQTIPLISPQSELPPEVKKGRSVKRKTLSALHAGSRIDHASNGFL